MAAAATAKVHAILYISMERTTFTENAYGTKTWNEIFAETGTPFRFEIYKVPSGKGHKSARSQAHHRYRTTEAPRPP